MLDSFFKKRSYTLKGFSKDIIFLVHNFNRIFEALKAKRINKQFRERILLAVTAVNKCKYCSFGHSLMALKSGCTREEISRIMNSDFTNSKPNEIIALTYAQHFAETKRSPDPDATKKLFSYYGFKKARDILLFIHMMEMGNLLGNTIDAFKSRLKGIPPTDGSVFLEFILFVLSYPFLLIYP
jgi:AhpD family alkylhydroperoxidase